MSMDFIAPRSSAVAGQRLSGSRDEQTLRESKHKRNEDLGDHFDQLALITNAMWELLQEAFPGLTIDVLTDKMREIDGRDGIYDNSTHRPARDCTSPTCDAKIMPGQPRCQFCGTEVGADPDPFVF